MRTFVGTPALALIAACASFGAESTPAVTTGPDGGVVGADAGSGDGSSVESWPCGHRFCAAFEDGSSGEWPVTEASPSSPVKLEFLPDAAKGGSKGGMRVSIPATTSSIWSHLDKDFPSVPGNELRYAFSIRFSKVNTDAADIEIADIVFGSAKGDFGSQIILSHANGKLRLVHEENTAPMDESLPRAIAADGWHSVVIFVRNLQGAAEMELQVDGAPSSAVPLTNLRPFTGALGLELGAAYVNHTITAPVVFDLDDVTFDAK